MLWPLQFFSSSIENSNDSFPSIIFQTVYEDMQDKEFESIKTMTRENDNTNYSCSSSLDDEIFFKRFITDYYMLKKKKKKKKSLQALQYSCDNETDTSYQNQIMTILFIRIKLDWCEWRGWINRIC